jgi:hypothetical protein
MPNVPPPASGLGSNSNYFLNNSGKSLNGVSTTIDIATDIVANSGFGFQLNSYSPANETSAIQQYVIAVDSSGQMTCIVNNWQNASTALINNWVGLYKLASATLPAGYQCDIALQNDLSGNVTAATYTVRVLSIEPATGSALDGYQTSFNNQQHVNYIGTDGHVHELVYTDRWGHTDLTAAAGAPAAAGGSALDGYETSFNNQQHVNYLGVDGHVHELVYTNQWAHTDLTAAAGAPAAAGGSALDGYETSFNNQQHVNYIGTDGHVHELVYTDHWAHTDLTAAAGAPAAAAGSKLDGYQTSFNNQQHVNYIGTDGHVHELVYTNHWGHTDLTAAAGAPAAAAGSKLDGYQTSFNNQQHVNYIGTDGHVHELVFTNQWGHTDLTAAANAPAPAAGSALDGYETSFNNQQHVNYIGTDGHVHELVYTNHWAHTDLTAAAGAPAAVAGSKLDGYQTSFNSQQHVNYIGTDGHVHELFYTDHWAQTDLNNVVLASVTQTLTQISGVSSADLSPIVAFELDIVGYDNGQSTTLSSGSGTITYTATNAMTVANAEPAYCEFDGGTVETANTAYGELPTGSSATFVQSFNKSSAAIKAAKLHGLSKSRPARKAAAA